MNNLEIIKLEHIFKTLGNRKRLALLVYLIAGESSIGKLSKALKMPYKTTGRNLIQLQEAGFINKRSNSNQTYFSINDNVSSNYVLLIEMIKGSCKKLDVKKIAKSLVKSLVKIDKEFSIIRKNNLMPD